MNISLLAIWLLVWLRYRGPMFAAVCETFGRGLLGLVVTEISLVNSCLSCDLATIEWSAALWACCASALIPYKALHDECNKIPGP
jgi:hypothetical protein